MLAPLACPFSMSFTRRPSDQSSYPPKQQEPPQRYPPMPTHPADQSSAAKEDWEPYGHRSTDDSYTGSGSLPPLQTKVPTSYEYKPYATRPDYRPDQPYQPTSPPSAFRPSSSSSSTTNASWDYSDARMQQIYRDRTFHQVFFFLKKNHCIPFALVRSLFIHIPFI